MIKAVIFDCFGVVIQDLSFRQMLEKVGKESPETRDRIIDLVDQSCEGVISMEESRSQIAELLNVEPEEWQRQMAVGEIKDPQMLALIKNLHMVYKTGIVSNVGRGGLHSRFTQAELDELFDVVVASGDVGMAKPEPGIFEYALDSLGVAASESIFVDDYEPYVEAARAVGMQAIQFKSFDRFRAELEDLLATDPKD